MSVDYFNSPARGKEGTSKLINAIDESVDRIRYIMDEYSDVGFDQRTCPI